MMSAECDDEQGPEDAGNGSAGPPGPDIRRRTYEFALRILKLCRAPHGDRLGRIMLAQLLRAGTAIGANVEEAQGAQSRKDFISKMSTARKEALEAHYWLRLVRDSEMLSEARMREIIDGSDQICKVLSAIVLSAKRSS